MCVFFILVSKDWVDHLWCLSCDIWYTSNITNITLNRFGILERMVSGIVQQVGRYRTIYSKIIRYLLDATRYLVFWFFFLSTYKQSNLRPRDWKLPCPIPKEQRTISEKDILSTPKMLASLLITAWNSV